MSRVQIGNAYTGTSGDLYGALDPSTVPGLTLQPGDRWWRTWLPVTTPYPYPTYTDFPRIKYADLWQSGDSFSDVLNTRVPASGSTQGGFYLEIPAGFDEQIVGFSAASNTLGAYTPLCRGIWGQGPDQCRISMQSQSMTSAQKAKVPTPQSAGGINNLYGLRIGPANGSPIHNYGFTLGGRDQGTNPTTGLPWNYNGFFCYQEGGGSTHTWLKVLGFGAADYNAPPGETNQINMYRCSDITFNGVEVSGINLDGTQTGGACAPNGSSNVTYQDLNVHDTFRSGVTHSTAGDEKTGTRTTNVTANNVRSLHNANHIRSITSGWNFPGLNFEGVAGAINYNNPEIWRDNNDVWNGAHVYIGNYQGSAQFRFFEPNYHPEIPSAQPSFANGCFGIQVPATYAGASNKQLISDITVILNGVSLTPVYSTGGRASSAVPSQNFVVLTN